MVDGSGDVVGANESNLSPVSDPTETCNPTPRESSSMESSATSADRKKPVGGGLSELSTQLRKLHATNHSQAAVIDRLERQLRILADTKGVSIADVRSSLVEACQGEAFSELQNEVAVLRAKLETAHLSNARNKSSTSFEKEAADRTIADLQLRIGELEEVEGVLRKEVSNLYKSLKDQTSKATRLEAMCAQQKEQIENNTEQAKMSRQMSTQLVTKAEADAEKEINAQKVEIDRLRGQVRDAETQLRLEIDKSKILEEEVDAREKELELRSEQFNSRFKLQDERIADMEQQLSSLYTAFGLEREDREGEADRRAVLETYLNNADSELAQQLRKVEETESRGNSPQRNSSPMAQAQSTPSLYSPEGKRTANPQQVPLSGWLMKKDKNILVGSWKKRYFALTRSSDGTCKMSYSEAPGAKVKGTFGEIVAGRSTVRQSTEHSRWPHAFELRINPHDAQSRVLCAAAPGRKCLDKWLAALRKVTEGPDPYMEVTEGPDPYMEAALKASMQEQQGSPAAQVSDMDMAIKASMREQSVRFAGASEGVERNSSSSPRPAVGGQRQQHQSNRKMDMKVAEDLYKSGLI